jgi:predicted enzyme related to lactoylglutathione lyase
MGRRERYGPGTFAWVDLRTTDLADARRFYAELFGWSYAGADTGGRGAYTAASLAGDAVAGLKPLAEEQSAQGVAPFWLNYVAIESADAAAGRARELGGAVHAEPFDTGAGRVSVIADPTGARLCLWESGEGIGACRVNDPGCLTWNELSTNDLATAVEFYSALFGWRIEPTGTGGAPPYWTIGHGGAARSRNGGLRELDREQEGAAPHWMPYFTVASLDEALARASSGGGSVPMGPFDLPGGRIAIVRDPQRALFGIFDGEVDD